MININSGATNSVSLRLQDKVVSETPIYLFEVKSIQSNEVIYFTAEDQSISNRFNLFRISEISGTTQSIALTQSIPKIRLKYGGSYNYTIYETENYNLEPTANILDWGKLIYKNSEWEDYFID